MKPLNIYIAFVIVTVLFSCGEKKHEVHVPEIPEALQDNTTSLKSYGRYSSDLTEELYAELVEKDPSLKKLQEDLKVYDATSDEPKRVFEKYNSKSTSYYASANHQAQMIGDSVLRKKMVTFITQSNDRYLKETKGINALISQISENNLNINHYHTALKIALTMPIIERYQSENAVKEKEFKNLIKEQEYLLKQINTFIPEF